MEGIKHRLLGFGFCAICCSLCCLHGVTAEFPVFQTDFQKDANGWRAERFCNAKLKNGCLRTDAVEGMPILSRFCNEIGGNFRLVLELKTQTESTLIFSWTAKDSPRRDKEKSLSLPLEHTNQWKSYEFSFDVSDALTSLAFQFSATEGTWEIRSIALFCRRSPPLSVRAAVKKESAMQYTVHSNAPFPIQFTVPPQTEPLSIADGEDKTVDIPLTRDGSLESAVLTLHTEGFPDTVYPLFRYYPKAKTNEPSPLGEWISKQITPDYTLDVSVKGDIARVHRKKSLNENEVVAVIAPIVHRRGVIPKFVLEKNTQKELPDSVLKFNASDCSLEISLNKGGIRFLMNTEKEELEGPCVCVSGTLQAGLLPGVEFLSKGGVSSSPIDLESPLNERRKPNPQWITSPYSVFATEKIGVMLQWEDHLQPTFASPNSFDLTDDHRISLLGTKIDATLRILPAASNQPLAEAVKMDIEQNGLPDVPKPPRTSKSQLELNLSALKMLECEDGLSWRYAVSPDWQRKPFADFFSVQSRLTGKVPLPKQLVSGGTDIANDAVFFLTERVEEWLALRKKAVESILALRQPDGSFLQRTSFPEVEHKATSFGYTAVRALELMEFARLTGDKALFATVEKSLNYLNSCDVPRGGFYRDSPLHTPDLQTAASFVWLYTWAYEFSGKKEYLGKACEFAELGLPFVYLRSGHVHLPYATVPKLGGTDRRKPLWFGVARPETGIIYAYALNILSKHDKTLDWKKIAMGILHTAEMMQYPDGEFAGCLPERFDLATQERQSWKVNPCALTCLRLALEGKLDTLCVLTDEKERYVSPYPLRLTPDANGDSLIEVYDVPESIPSFQILRNGSRISTVNGSGVLTLD